MAFIKPGVSRKHRWNSTVSWVTRPSTKSPIIAAKNVDSEPAPTVATNFVSHDSPALFGNTGGDEISQHQTWSHEPCAGVLCLEQTADLTPPLQHLLGLKIEAGNGRSFQGVVLCLDTFQPINSSFSHNQPEQSRQQIECITETHHASKVRLRQNQAHTILPSACNSITGGRVEMLCMDSPLV